MRAMVLAAAGRPLELRDLPDPVPGPGEVRVRVGACGVCRTDLHVVDGELTEPKLPLVPGHQTVGIVEERGTGVTDLAVGDRVGIPWLGWTCGECAACRRGEENLCPAARFTGYTIDGGFAESAVADARYAFPIPDGYDDVSAAPLLCAGLIGARSLRLAGNAPRLGLYGFGAAAHIVCQVAVHEGRAVHAFTRPGDETAQDFARELGAVWAGDSETEPPDPLDAAIIFAPVGSLVPAALRAVRPGGRVICAGIHMSDIPAFPYSILWGERSVKSVANLTREDGAFLARVAPPAGAGDGRAPVRTEVEAFPLEQANEALDRLRSGRIRGAAVLAIGTDS